MPFQPLRPRPNNQCGRFCWARRDRLSRLWRRLPSAEKLALPNWIPIRQSSAFCRQMYSSQFANHKLCTFNPGYNAKSFQSKFYFFFHVDFEPYQNAIRFRYGSWAGSFVRSGELGCVQLLPGALCTMYRFAESTFVVGHQTRYANICRKMDNQYTGTHKLDLVAGFKILGSHRLNWPMTVIFSYTGSYYTV